MLTNVYNCNSLKIRISSKHIETDHEEFFFVHSLISVQIKHVESNMKTGFWLWNKI